MKASRIRILYKQKNRALVSEIGEGGGNKDTQMLQGQMWVWC